MIVWSYGGGTQSIALAILVAKGLLPVPDRIVFADTGGEMTEVWDYMHTYVEPLLLNSVGKKIEVASHTLAKVDFYREKDGEKTLLIPAFTQTGKLSTFCSKEWKTMVVRRHLGGQVTMGNIVMWLGMSTDEIERLKPADVKWIEHHWPLCDMPTKAGYGIRTNRRECRQMVLDFGWPDPPRSACVWCPNLDNPQWRRMKQYAPQDFKRAVQVSRLIHDQDRQGGVWLHEDRQPLDQTDFARERQPALFEGCESGFCWT